MLTSNAVAQNGNYGKYYSAAVFGVDVLERARNLFDEYRSNGVFLNGSFSNPEWRLTDQLHNTTISFRFSELEYRRNAALWIGCSYAMLIDSIKAYAMFQMGSVSISGIREIVNSLRAITELTEDTLLNAALDQPFHIAEFLEALPGETARREAMIESIEERALSNRRQNVKRRQRTLSEFSAYFKFNDIIVEFWESAAYGEKLFWFPLYLWWTLTAILPLRTTEFLLTPRKCLIAENGHYIITLRRTLQKGSVGRVAYKVDKDYEIVRYVIPNKMADDIKWYIDATDEMPPTALSTLFVKEPHYAHFARKPDTTLGYYTYTNLSTCLRYFQENIIGINAESRIRLGDTRHLAMIGLILSGGSPLICKELARHDDINISSNYYSNISSFIESATYEAHLKYRGWAAELAERDMPVPNNKNQGVPVQDGFCRSEVYSRGEIYDCIKSIGEDGEIGNCRRCPHFIDGASGMHFLYADSARRKEQVDRDSQYLLQTLEAVRRGIGMPEDIQSTLLRLQQSGAWYGRSLIKEWEVSDNGKAEKNTK